MQVKDERMYHLHKKGNFDYLWYPGNKLVVDDNFTSNFTRLLTDFNTNTSSATGKSESFEDILLDLFYFQNIENLPKETLIELLKDSRKIIHKANMFKREKAFEEIREKKFSDLPSRVHSIWVSDNKSLSFWKHALIDPSHIDDVALFEVSLTGNLFKSSDYLIPEDDLSYGQLLEAAEEYWNPNFSKIPSDKNEFLFQGEVNVTNEIRLR